MMTLNHTGMWTLAETNIPNQTHHSVTGNSHKAQLPLKNEPEYMVITDTINTTTIVDRQSVLLSVVIVLNQLLWSYNLHNVFKPRFSNYMFVMIGR